MIMSMEEAGVLFVDDEEQILKSIKRRVMDQPFISYFADSVERALNILENNEIAVVVTDLKMPNINGVEFLKILGDKYPDIVKIVLSGYFEISTILAAIKSGQVFQFLTKPWKFDEELFPAIYNAINKYLLVNQKKFYEEEAKRLKQELDELNKIIELFQIKNINDKEHHLYEQLLDKTRSYIEKSNMIFSNLIKNKPNEHIKTLLDEGVRLLLVIKKITEKGKSNE